MMPYKQFATALMHCLHQNAVRNPGTTFEALVRSLGRDFTVKAMTTGTLNDEVYEEANITYVFTIVVLLIVMRSLTT